MAFYPKIKSFLLCCWFIFLLTSKTNAQENSSYWEVDFAKGSILRHKKLIAHLVRAHPEFVSISWQKKSDTTRLWKKRYNYPDWGISLSYQDFNNQTLGKLIGIQYQTTYYLLNRNAKNQLNIQVRTGIAYNSSPLDLLQNNKNVAMSSTLQLAEIFKLEYKRSEISKHLGFHIGLLFSHYSNASYKKPNFGMNTVFLSTGLSFQSKPDFNYPEKVKKEKINRQKIHYNIASSVGVHESKAGLGRKPVYTISGYGSKIIGKKSKLLLGIDFFNSQAVKKLAEFRYVSQIEYPDRKLLDHKQIGLFTGHELIFNKISLETSVGYYLYNPLHYTSDIYQKIALKQHLNTDKIALSLSLKVHKFKAEYLTLGLHYKLN